MPGCVAFFNLFGKKPDLRQQLFEAAARGDAEVFAGLCRKHRESIAKDFPGWRQAPESIRQDREQIKLYGNGLVSVARFFAERMGDPSLITLLQGADETNPVVLWQRRLADAQRKLEAQEHTTARDELVTLLRDTEGLAGTGAEHLRSYTLGSLAACQFHLGQLDEAEKATRRALDIVSPDPPAMARYLTELFELERYRGRTDKARQHALEIARLLGSQEWRRRADTVGTEPLLRVVASVDGQQTELDQMRYRPNARVQFGFVRNRASLGESQRLNREGKQLAGEGQFAPALALFERAAAADPHDPDPPFMVGLTRVYLKQYAEGIRAYETVERLGPGWYHARTDLWLARELAAGRLAHDVWETLMALEHLPPAEALAAADRALAEAPLLAPLLYRKALALEGVGRKEEAAIPLRVALEHNDEPNLHTRLLLRLSQLTTGDEARELVRRAAELNGDLIAGAMARFLLSAPPV